MYHGRLVQEALQSSHCRSSGTIVQGGHLGLLVPYPIKSVHRGCFVCDGVGYLRKDYSHNVIRGTLISSMKDSGSTKSERGRGSGTYGGGHRAT